MNSGRIIEAQRTNFRVMTEDGEVTATVRGDFHETGDFPKVGDYVVLSAVAENQAVIESIKPRTSVIKRQIPDEEEEQIIATNVDVIFIVMGLDGDYNISRLERYLLLAKESGCRPVVVLNKVDLLEATATEQIQAAVAVAGETLVLTVSARTGAGMPELAEQFGTDQTVVLLGSSGAGKSTITNWLLGQEVQAVQETRSDDNRGRHTTTTRHLFTLPQGGFLIDTPGMRELGVAASSDDEQIIFARVEYYADQCRFNDCDHEKSAGCAVLTAIEDGELDERQVRNYLKLVRERQYHKNKNIKASVLHREQTQKRQAMKEAALKRKRLSRGQ